MHTAPGHIAALFEFKVLILSQTLTLSTIVGYWREFMGFFGSSRKKKTKPRGKTPRKAGKPKVTRGATARAKPQRRRTSAARQTVKSSRKKTERSFGMRIVYWSFVLILWGTIGLIALAGYVVFANPNQNVYTLPKRQEGIILLADNGEVLAESGSFLGDDVRLPDLPSYVPEAVLAIEDRRFRSHFGIDLFGLGRAMYANLKAGRLTQGGSTVTQQLAKNLFLSPQRTLHRKIQEAILALWLEHKFTKDEILQLYLNRVYFGGGAYGIEAAAKTFYSKHARDLTLAEAASMAAVLKAPSRYNPKASSKKSRARTKLVLNAMADQGYINAKQAQLAIKNPAAVKAINYIPATQYVVDWVRELVPQYTGHKAEGLIIQTTIDGKLQRASEKALRRRLLKEGVKQRASQGALVIMSPKGEVRAMVGGKSYKKSQFNRAVKAMRQPGSAFKPFVYLSAIGLGYRPGTVVNDKKFCIKKWCPENYNKRYAGPVSLTTALAQSLNSVAVRLAVEAGPARVASTAKRLGIRSKLTPNASIALGTSEVNLLELTSAYTPFANGGNGVLTHVIKRIVTTDGRILYERQGSGPGRVLNEFEVGAMNTMMAETVTSGTGKRAKVKGHVVAGKTGTTQDYRDAWFLGYSAYYVGGVWVGNDNSSPTRRTTGGGLPAQIWHDVMVQAHAGLSARVLPGRLQEDEPAIDLSPYGIDDELLRRGRDGLTGFFKSIFGGGDRTSQAPQTQSNQQLRKERAERRRRRQRQREENR